MLFRGLNLTLDVVDFRVFPFREGDKCCREADAKGTAKIFDKGEKHLAFPEIFTVGGGTFEEVHVADGFHD